MFVLSNGTIKQGYLVILGLKGIGVFLVSEYLISFYIYFLVTVF